MKNWNKILPDFENGLLGPKINNKKYIGQLHKSQVSFAVTYDSLYRVKRSRAHKLIKQSRCVINKAQTMLSL